MEQAAAQTGVSYQLSWEPFLLNPHMDAAGEDLREHIVHKYGARGARMLDDPNNHFNFVNERKIYPTVKVSE